MIDDDDESDDPHLETFSAANTVVKWAMGHGIGNVTITDARKGTEVYLERGSSNEGMLLISFRNDGTVSVTIEDE